MLKKYKFGFDVSGFILFLFVMIPNFIRFAFPAPNDVLRVESVTKTTDMIGSLFQVLMIVSLCTLINMNRAKLKVSLWIIGVFSLVVLCYTFGLLYYMGNTNIYTTLGLTVFPCIVFLFYSIDRKNIIALFLTMAYLACPLTYAIVNFKLIK